MARNQEDPTPRDGDGNYSFYKMYGVNRTVRRRKGGASRDKIKNDPQFEETRRINAEFGGRSRSASFIMHTIMPLKALADKNIAGPLNALLKPVQEMDKTSKLGQRSIELSHWPAVLAGYSLNRLVHFDGIVRNHLEWTLDKANRKASIHIPQLTTGINFHPSPYYPLCSLMVTFGVVPDLYSQPVGRYTASAEQYEEMGTQLVLGDWFPCTEGAPPFTFTLEYPLDMPDSHHSMVLAIGIRYGRLQYNQQVDQVPRAGAAKILAVR
ncbi:hypothetical protein [Paraflavitalea pollutisoli]|uniref:hypothetical protein n=1 Tax=Paraflavitalea pollutisoli TaxID=3034143 RepID=UPI0023EB540A|nr:hypothetical protein [Paraflavitalea sp. H1-2-19X]